MRVTLLDRLRKSAYAAGEISLLRQTHSIGRRHVPNTAANRYNFRAVQSSASGSNISTSSEGLRSRLTSELKSAMKARDTFSSTVLRSVIAEVYAADKTAGKSSSDAQIASILKKAVTRRTESALQYTAASRAELAVLEEREANYIANLLPPSMPDEQIEVLLKNTLHELQASGANLQDPKRSLGLLLKTFYQQIDKSAVDGQLVKQKAEDLLEKNHS